MAIHLRAVTKAFPLPGGGQHVALDRVDLQVEKGETLCLIGGSGSGKTTALRLMNGLLRPDEGQVLVDGKDVADQDPIRLRRGMGYVVQRGALFPHLTVRQNVALLCDLEGWPVQKQEARVGELLEMMRLPVAEFADRYPSELSGGQRQRVGVARALALDPPIVLLDEPFGALDPITRRQLQREFAELREQQNKTMVFVTHDLGEAFALADRIALMENGRILQVGSAEELRNHPADEHVAEFVTEFAVGRAGLEQL